MTIDSTASAGEVLRYLLVRACFYLRFRGGALGLGERSALAVSKAAFGSGSE